MNAERLVGILIVFSLTLLLMLSDKTDKGTLFLFFVGTLVGVMLEAIVRSRHADRRGATKSTVEVGTPQYYSPLQLEDDD